MQRFKIVVQNHEHMITNSEPNRRGFEILNNSGPKSRRFRIRNLRGSLQISKSRRFAFARTGKIATVRQVHTVFIYFFFQQTASFRDSTAHVRFLGRASAREFTRPRPGGCRPSASRLPARRPPARRRPKHRCTTWTSSRG